MSTLSVDAITDASGGTTASINGYTPSASNMTGRNRIINGDMRIDQRNNGAAVTGSSAIYAVDRFRTDETGSAVYEVQRSTEAPDGFTNSLKITVTTGATPAATERFTLAQYVEGSNLADLGFGKSWAKNITLSFWVRSSLTGTFSGSFVNAAIDRGYAYEYTISSANTWEKKSITLTADTTGTWATDNTNGLRLFWDLGAGSSVRTSPNAWSSLGGIVYGATGAVSLVATSGATFYITGVQLEAGSVATPFEHRQYGQELALCQRYYELVDLHTTGYGSGGGAPHTLSMKVNKRASPTVTYLGDSGGWLINWDFDSAQFINDCVFVSSNSRSAGYRIGAQFSLASEL